MKLAGTRGFSRGLNQLTHPTIIRDNELAESQNVFFSQNGVLSKRPGSTNFGEAKSGVNKILSLQGTYSIGSPAKNYLLRIGDDGIVQYYSFISNDWVDVTGSPTFNTTVDTQILQAYGAVYFLNSKDKMTKWNGSSFSTFTPLANPSAAPTTSKKGTLSGGLTYYYRYVWYNDIGNTLPSTAVSVASMPEPQELTAENYVEVTLPTPPSGTKYVGIFRGTTAGDEVYLTKINPSQTTYDDKGYDKVDPLYAVPTGNTTGGFHFKFATVYHDALIGVTDELGNDTLVFSGGGDKFESFARTDGGGYYSWRRDDGDPITAIHAFQDDLYVFKGGKVGAFNFDESGGSVKDINLAVGAVSNRSVHAAGNDLRFWSRSGAYSLGNEPNFADIIRTKVLSARAEKIVQSVTPTDINKISGVYYKDHSLWGLPMGEEGEGITTTITYNEKYASWSEWLGMSPHVFSVFVDDSNRERLFYGDESSGNVVECWNGTSDNGNPIVWRVATKQFDMDMPHMYKTFGKIYFIFGNITGVNTRITLVEDGVRSQVPLALYAETGNMGFGVDQFGTIMFGESSGEYIGDVSGLTVKYVDLGNKDLTSLQAILSNNGVKDNIEFMGLYIEYSESSQELPASKKLQRVVE